MFLNDLLRHAAAGYVYQIGPAQDLVQGTQLADSGLALTASFKIIDPECRIPWQNSHRPVAHRRQQAIVPFASFPTLNSLGTPFWRPPDLWP